MNSIDNLRSTAARPQQMPTKRERMIITSLSGSLLIRRLSGAKMSFMKNLLRISLGQNMQI
jgi:hypothetical protein